MGNWVCSYIIVFGLRISLFVMISMLIASYS